MQNPAESQAQQMWSKKDTLLLIYILPGECTAAAMNLWALYRIDPFYWATQHVKCLLRRLMSQRVAHRISVAAPRIINLNSQCSFVAAWNEVFVSLRCFYALLYSQRASRGHIVSCFPAKLTISNRSADIIYWIERTADFDVSISTNLPFLRRNF